MDMRLLLVLVGVSFLVAGTATALHGTAKSLLRWGALDQRDPDAETCGDELLDELVVAICPEPGAERRELIKVIRDELRVGAPLSTLRVCCVEAASVHRPEVFKDV